MADSRFLEQTSTINRWVGNEPVPSIPLAAELLAWYHFVISELDSDMQIRVIVKASDLLSDIYKDGGEDD